MHRFAALVEEHADELALLECRNVGMPIGDARGQLGMIVDVLRYYAGAVDKFFGHTIPVEREGVALTFREPIGVVGLITPWNFPLNIANWKIAPALAAGNTVVLKPASLTPLSVLRYAELAVEAGIPAGALNVVPGPGATVGNALVEHPGVGKIGFTGSTEVGAGIARRAAATVKRVTLELGGKSACVVFADADLEKVGRLAPYAVFENCGQDCCARSRLIVQESVADEVVERYSETARNLRVGMPESPDTEIGPLISSRPARDGRALRRRRPRRGRAARGRRRAPRRRPRGRVLLPPDGARGRAQRHDRRPRGDLRPGRLGDHVLATRPTPCGSQTTRRTACPARCGRATAPASCASPAPCAPGVLGVNTNSSVFVQAPFGGYKQSGVGKELGMEALAHNTELKSVFISTE